MVAIKAQIGRQSELLDATGRRTLTACSPVLDAWADWSLSDLRLALGLTRLAIKIEIERLPEEAFDEQPLDSSGQEVWSAGQIVNHIGCTQIGMSDWLRDALGMQPREDEHSLLNLTDAGWPGMLTREQSLHVLDDAARDLEAIFALIPESAIPTARAVHPLFGDVAIRAGIQATIRHERDHMHQLASLRQPQPADEHPTRTANAYARNPLTPYVVQPEPTPAHV